MKIKIKAEGHNISLWFPTSILKSRLAYYILKRALRDGAKKADKSFEMPITHKQVLMLYASLRQCIKANGHFNVVEVKTHDNDDVLIRI